MVIHTTKSQRRIWKLLAIGLILDGGENSEFSFSVIWGVSYAILIEDNLTKSSFLGFSVEVGAPVLGQDT